MPARARYAACTPICVGTDGGEQLRGRPEERRLQRERRLRERDRERVRALVGVESEQRRGRRRGADQVHERPHLAVERAEEARRAEPARDLVADDDRGDHRVDVGALGLRDRERREHRRVAGVAHPDDVVVVLRHRQHRVRERGLRGRVPLARGQRRRRAGTQRHAAQERGRLGRARARVQRRDQIRDLHRRRAPRGRRHLAGRRDPFTHRSQCARFHAWILPSAASCANTISIARSLSARIVSAGFGPTETGMIDPSRTIRSSWPNTRPA